MSSSKTTNPQTRTVNRKLPLSQSNWNHSRTWRTLVVTIFFIALIFVAFWGQSPAGTPILPNQIAKLRVVSDFDFSYVSPSLTEEKREAALQRVASIYKVDTEPYLKFVQDVEFLLDGVDAFIKENPGQERMNSSQLDQFVTTFIDTSFYKHDPEDLQIIFSQVPLSEIREVFEEGLLIVRRIVSEGILEIEEDTFAVEQGLTLVLVQKDKEKDISRESTLSRQEAFRNLRLNVSVMELPNQAWRALYRFLNVSLEPNVVFDQIRNEQHIESLLSQVEPVVVEVKQGDTIIFPNETVSPFAFEQLQFYRQQLSERERGIFGFDLLLLSRIIATVGIALGAVLYIMLVLPNYWSRSRYLGLMALALLINVLIIRIVLMIGGTQINSGEANWIAILPYVAPTALGAIVITLMLQSSAGLLVGAMTSLFFTIMMGNSIEILFGSFFSSVVGIYFSQNIRVRGKVVRAGVFSGIALSVSALFVGVFEGYPSGIVLIQMLAAIVTGFLTGVLVIGVIPILENLFKIVTDISLLELSDFNHPLLRRMQVEAPGTWHHSLMVANLSESVALEIGANPLVCRSSALFHDVGKMVKPEYFVENQKSGENPHVSQNPSISALIIKAHIKEGVELARQHKLPQVIIDIIRQHHGTSLISYFFHKAKEKKSEQELLPFMVRDEKVDESNYRYDGPKPNFKESAIISLVDSCEAASRSLKKVNQQNIQDLVDNIFQDRIQDYQLAEAPLTLQELEKIRQHIVFSLLNMLHARIEYPKSDEESAKQLTEKIQSKDEILVDRPDGSHHSV